MPADTAVTRVPDSPPATPPVAHAEPHAVELPTVPGCEVLRELGRGGMGVVYLARQRGFDRLVAVKIVRACRSDSAEASRFRREITAAAALNHPGIVQVYDSGRGRDGAYYLLEYCPNGSLSDRLKSAALAPADAARLVARLADAVHAAHAAGILHRDLKPGNILFDAGGSPKVADFGLAKWFLGDFERLTETGTAVGTPGYMAPEQASLGGKTPGPALDIYSLGAILYECVAGRPPFVGENSVEVVMMATAVEPLPLSLVRPGVPRDFDTICLKCLEIDPARRYATAADLAADLNRWLAGEPIRARPATAPERWLKWARRKPTAAALAGVSAVTAALVVALAVGGWWWAADAERRRATEAELRRDAEAQRDAAREQRRRARATVDQMLDDGALNWLASLPKATAAQKQFLERAAGYYQDFAADAAGETERMILQAGSDLQLARIHHLLGDRAAAETAAKRAIERLQTAGSDAPPEVPRRLARAWNQLSLLARDAGRADEVQRCRERAIAIARELVRAGGEPGDQSDLAKYLGNWAITVATGPTPERAEPAFREAIAVGERAMAAQPTSYIPASTLANNLCGLALVERRRGDKAAAARLYRRAIELMQPVLEAHRDQPDYADLVGRARTQLSTVLGELGRLDESVAELRAAAEVYSQLTAEYPGVTRYVVSRANVGTTLGDEAARRGDWPAARTWYQQVIAGLEGLSAAERRDPRTAEALASAYSGRARVVERFGQWSESLADWERAIPLSRPDVRAIRRACRLLPLAHLGRGDEVRREAAALTAATSAVDVLWQCARASAVADDPNTWAYLRRVYQAGPRGAGSLLAEPEFAAKRDRPEFLRLIWDIAEWRR